MQMENKDFFNLCQKHNNQYLMYLRIQFPESDVSDCKNISLYQNKCAQCLVSEKVDKRNYALYEQFIFRVSKKYKQIEQIEELIQQIKKQNENMKYNTKYKTLYEIQAFMTETIEKVLLQPFNQSRSQFESISAYKLEHSQQLLKLYRLKCIIQFEQFYLYELLEQSAYILNQFPLLIKFKSTTKPFSISNNSDIQFKQVNFYDQKPSYQSVKSNLVKFQEKIFIFGDNMGNIYYYNHQTNIKSSKRYHNEQICVIEKITEDTFCSGSTDMKILAFKITQNDNLKLISSINLPYFTFRLRRVDNQRIAANQNNMVYILNFTKPKMIIEKKLKVNKSVSEVFGILHINNQLIVLHRDGILNIWNWRKSQLIRSHYLNKQQIKQSPNIQDMIAMIQQGEQNNEQVEEEIEDDVDEQDENSQLDHNLNQEDEFDQGDEDDEYDEEEDDDDESFDEQSDIGSNESNDPKKYSRIRLLGKNKIAVVTDSNQIKIFDFNDFYFKNPHVNLNINYIILCLESIPKTDLILIAGQGLNIYNLKQNKMILQIKNKSNEIDENYQRFQQQALKDKVEIEKDKNNQISQQQVQQVLKKQFGNQGLIGGTILDQNQIVSVKGEEIELLFIQLSNFNQMLNYQSH